MISQKYALLSVTHKQGLADLGLKLHQLGYEILSTSGSGQVLLQADCPYTEVSQYTHSPELLDGRVKTLHPKIYAGILHRRQHPSDQTQLQDINAGSIDIICVNFYNFAQALKTNSQKSTTDLLEFIDIGGPCLLRAAAKNHASVLPLCDPSDYEEVLKYLASADGTVPLHYRQYLAKKAFIQTSTYDAMIAQSLKGQDPSSHKTLSSEHHLFAELHQKIVHLTTSPLRYGENSHQQALLAPLHPPAYLGAIEQQHGKELSYNNYLDMDGAGRMIMELAPYSAMVVIKHTNPCGVALSPIPPKDLSEPTQEASATKVDLWRRARDGDQLSSFGGILATSITIDSGVAHHLKEHFLEVIMAPKFSEGALEILREKPDLRLVTAPWLTDTSETPPLTPTLELRSVLGAWLLQEPDPVLKIPTQKLQRGEKALPPGWELAVEGAAPLSTEHILDLIMALKIVKHTKSNAITVVKDRTLLGSGCGMSSRIHAAQWAFHQRSQKPAHKSSSTAATTSASMTETQSPAEPNQKAPFDDAVLASDAFFPFDDVIHLAADHGINAIIAPKGSRRDGISIKAARQRDVTLIFCHKRHFRH